MAALSGVIIRGLDENDNLMTDLIITLARHLIDERI